MDFWQKARNFAEEAAKRSQELTISSSSKLSDLVSETAKRSKDITIGSSKLSDIVSETAKRSKEIAAEASIKIKTHAVKGADQIKSLAEGITPRAEPNNAAEPKLEDEEAEAERFGITEELREFVKDINFTTFQDFPLQDDSEMSNVEAVSNVRQDLTEWQEKHANLVLSTVKEISKLRYELCPRIMKERKFWRIYFILVNSHVAPYEKRYVEEAMQNSVEQVKDDKVEELTEATVTSNSQTKKSSQQSKISAEQDLDVFLLGGDSDDGRDDANGNFDRDFDKMVNSSDDENEKL
ncbi:uncharacterized protein LOC126671073 [Mercurialis annua]|uniref:uncharacterized protein LOC126671073 n=1 Tax=Mercurialis annua TaxID=3986 RepID=UPI00215EC6E9|nr:uncharacterized protein LOC126671073 [Mercurialis annua]